MNHHRQAKDTLLQHYALMMGGQLLSLFGTHLVTFSFAVWVFTLTGSVVQMALLSVFAILPTVLISPLAGVIADRAPKKKTLILVDSALAVVSVVVFILASQDLLQPWHLYISAIFGGMASGLQRPLFESITPLMVPEEKLVQVNGVVQTVAGVSQLLSPALAGGLVLAIGLSNVLLIDLLTFVVAVSTLAFVAIPRLDNPRHEHDNWWQDLREGFRYVFDRSGLRALFLFVTARNFAFAVCEILALPLLLTLTTADKAGLVLSLSGIGIVIGGALMAVTGGTRRKIDSVFLAQLLTAFAMILAGVTTNLWLLGFAVALAFVAFPVEESTSTTIMQTRVPNELLGRVSAVRQMMTLASVPLAMLISAPLAEYLFEPWLQQGSSGLHSLATSVVGTGEGRGMAVMLFLMGFLLTTVTVLARFYRPLVTIEEDLAMSEPKPEAAGAVAAQTLAQRRPRQPVRRTATRQRAGLGTFLAERPYLISLALLALVALWMLAPSAPSPQQAIAAGNGETSPTTALQRVQVRSMSATATGLQLTFTAQTEPDQIARISSELDGILVELAVERGSVVAKGDLLARVSPGSLSAALAGVRAEQQSARLEYNAQAQLSDRGLTPEQGKAAAYAALEAATARVTQLEAELAKADIRAPFSGLVADYSAEEGDYLGVGQPILSLINIDPVVAVGSVSERDVQQLQIGQPATLTLLNGQTIDGRINYISPISDPTTRTFDVEVRVPNPQLAIRAGVTTQVQVDLQNVPAYKISPALLTLRADGAVQVATVDQSDRVRLHEVTLVRSEADGIWVSGIPANARLITLGQGFVRDGDQVIAVEEGSAAVANLAPRQESPTP